VSDKMEPTKEPPPSLQEFINTEKEFVAKLESVFKMYLEPTEQFKYFPLWITQEDVFAIIANIVVVMKIHSTFLNNLIALSAKPPAEQLIGPLFIELEPSLKKYRVYVNSIENGLRNLCQRIISSEDIHAFLKKAEGMEIPKTGETLPSFLSLPFKRIKYYQKYLVSSVTFSSSDKPDYNNIMKGLRVIDSIDEIIEKQNESITFLVKVLDIDILKKEEAKEKAKEKEFPLTWKYFKEEVQLFIDILENREKKR